MKKFMIMSALLCASHSIVAMNASVLALVRTGINLMGLRSSIQKMDFNILPCEVQGEIVKNIFCLKLEKSKDKEYTDQKKFRDMPFNSPILLGLKQIDEFFKMDSYISCRRIGEKYIPTQYLFVLPPQEKETCLKLANLGMQPELTKNEHQVMERLPEDIKKGMKLEIAPPNKMYSFAIRPLRNTLLAGCVLMGCSPFLEGGALLFSKEYADLIHKGCVCAPTLVIIGVLLADGPIRFLYGKCYPDEKLECEKITL